VNMDIVIGYVVGTVVTAFILAILAAAKEEK